MIYLSSPILDSGADVILLPVSLSGRVFPGSLQEAIYKLRGDEYLQECLDDIENDLIHVGTPGFINTEDGPLLLHIPVYDKNEAPLSLTDVLAAVREAILFVVGSSTLCTIAVPTMGGEFSWDTWEGIYERMDILYAERGIELQIFSEENDEEENVCDSMEGEPLVVGV